MHAVATRAGYTIGTWKVDKDGVDLTLRDEGFMVDVQLKCTCEPTTTKRGFSYQLDTSTYNKLRDPERSAPGYLCLLIAPKNVDNWLRHNPKELLLACHGYWARIQDRPDAATGDTKAIAFDLANVLNGAAMAEMFVDSLSLVRRGVA